MRQIRRFPFTFPRGPAGFVMPARRQSRARTRGRKRRRRRRRRRTGRREERRGESPSGLISQTNAADWILACCKMDRSLWIADYRPPLTFHLASLLRTAVPAYIALSSLSAPATPCSRCRPSILAPLRPSRRRLRLRQRFPSVQSSSICHMPTQLRPSLFPFPLFLSRYENLTARRPRQLAGILKRSQDRPIDEGHACRSSETEPARSRNCIQFARLMIDLANAYPARVLYSQLHREMQMRANLQTTPLICDCSRLRGKGTANINIWICQAALRTMTARNSGILQTEQIDSRRFGRNGARNDDGRNRSCASVHEFARWFDEEETLAPRASEMECKTECPDCKVTLPRGTGMSCDRTRKRRRRKRIEGRGTTLVHDFSTLVDL